MTKDTVNSEVSCIYETTTQKPPATTVQMKTLRFLMWCHVLPQCQLLIESLQFTGILSIYISFPEVKMGKQLCLPPSELRLWFKEFVCFALL